MLTDGQEALAVFGKSQREWDPYGNSDRRLRKMAKIDALPESLKAVVHDFGWLTVKEFTEAGVSNAKTIRRLIHTVLYEHSHEYRSRIQAKAAHIDTETTP